MISGICWSDEQYLLLSSYLYCLISRDYKKDIPKPINRCWNSENNWDSNSVILVHENKLGRRNGPETEWTKFLNVFMFFTQYFLLQVWLLFPFHKNLIFRRGRRDRYTGCLNQDTKLSFDPLIATKLSLSSPSAEVCVGFLVWIISSPSYCSYCGKSN